MQNPIISIVNRSRSQWLSMTRENAEIYNGPMDAIMVYAPEWNILQDKLFLVVDDIEYEIKIFKL